jgi:hypothetical protein
LKIPCSKLQGIFPVRNFNRSIIRSLTPQQAAGNALAIAGHGAVQLKNSLIPLLFQPQFRIDDFTNAVADQSKTGYAQHNK